MRIAVDIGGTFTDAVLLDEVTGLLTTTKALSTPTELTEGVLASVDALGLPMGEVSLFIHGSTVVINAILERKGARTALVTTQGFRDVYEIGRINRPDSFNPQFTRHQPLIPRELIFEMPERILADGTVRMEFDEAAANEIAQRLVDLDIEAVAIVFLHSYAHPEHERRMVEVLLKKNPKLFVTASHEISREYREYERTSTTAANAFVGPIVSAYLEKLESRLEERKFDGSLLVMQSNGGLLDVETAGRQCVQMMESGPAGGVVGTMALCDELGIESAVSFDMGGTTAKACVVQRGQPSFSPDYFVGGYNTGLAIRIPVLDIIEVGVGGGSIAWLNEVGGLHVGPRSAGAEPGPACYGRGGVEPTITDANLLLGRISAEAFHGGSMPLDTAAAERAFDQELLQALGLSQERAALGMLEVATSEMSNAVRSVTLNRGLDPRDFTLVAYGGGGPLHGAEVARLLSIGTVVVPRNPGHFSAVGMLTADWRRDRVRTLFANLDALKMETLETSFGQLENEGKVELDAAEVRPLGVVFERAADMRYVGQEHTVTVGLPADLAHDPDGSRKHIKTLFDEVHERRYSHSAPEEPCQIVSIRVATVGRLAKPTTPILATGGSTPPASAQLGTRPVAFPGQGYVASLVYNRDEILADNVIEGPAIIQESASTTPVAPGDMLRVGQFGQLVITIGASV
jgi:N-methylhydantoinase A